MTVGRGLIAAVAGFGVGCAEPPPREAPTAALATPSAYVCFQISNPPVIDGRLDDVAWASARWSSAFVDIEGAARPTPWHTTRMKMLWSETHLYIAAELHEPHVWGSLTEHDSIVYHDNDFEIFIDPDGDRRAYYEIEINALGTIFDLFLDRPYIDGGHADHDWELAGMESAVDVQGTLNDASDEDDGWTVEFALPWASLAEEARRRTPPHPGDTWRMNFSRVQWHHEVIDGKYRRRPNLREDNWVWSPQGVINMHIPERWGYVTFTQ